MNLCEEMLLHIHQDRQIRQTIKSLTKILPAMSTIEAHQHEQKHL